MVNRQRGFTLIELLVVIAIIGILSSVVLASLNSARTKSRDARRISDIKQLQLALELYFDDNGTYPDGTNPGLGGLAPNYIAQVPTPPTGSGQSAYGYATDANDVDYVLMGTLEDASHSAIIGNDVDGTVLSVNCGTESSGSESPANYCVQP